MCNELKKEEAEKITSKKRKKTPSHLSKSLRSRGREIGAPSHRG